MSLKTWHQAAWLREHKTSPREIQDLLALADRDLKSASAPGIGPDWQHNIAYNAALSCAAAALAVAGYRPARGQHHYRLIHSLSLTMGSDMKETVRLLEAARKKRNVGIYERAGVIGAGEAKEILALANNLRGKVADWLSNNHPEYSSPRSP